MTEYLNHRLDRIESMIQCLFAASDCDRAPFLSCEQVVGVPKAAECHDDQPPRPDGQAQFREWSCSPTTLRVIVDATILFEKERGKYFESTFFGDPAWAMLLDLYRADLGDENLSITAACIGSGAAQTTALRYLRQMEICGLVKRDPDPDDGRRTYVRLTNNARIKLTEYFSAFSNILHDLDI